MSIRRTRHEYILSLASTQKKKKPKVEKVKKNPVQIKVWEYNIPSLGFSGSLFAFTRSEARAAIKHKHNIKGRVPIGTKIIQLC